ncbi:MAG: hypothetical protein JXA33_00525 [Anaerolineae bacterium]|nr:hypothetical protein [Anaerolineae bacterium]
MQIPLSVSILGVITLGIVIVVIILYLSRARQINLTQSKIPGERPEWMATTPPKETLAATQADGEGITVYDYDPGEKLAAPFAEQIEDILRARLRSDPTLASLDVDLGSTSEGNLEIWVNGECYTDINQLPNPRLREAFRQAVEQWQA